MMSPTLLTVIAYPDVPKLSSDEIAAILVDANKILAELLRDYEIDDERRAAG